MESIIQKLEDTRVLYISKENDDMFEFGEMCDYYFSIKLTKEEVLQLAEELKEAANS